MQRRSIGVVYLGKLFRRSGMEWYAILIATLPILASFSRLWLAQPQLGILPMDLSARAAKIYFGAIDQPSLTAK
ncbi:MAG: hypothetical protein JWM11_7914 [Planctomycetaceae bacterium]|nr:hypothetical protein [Planctomycetaceae bacterium]